MRTGAISIQILRKVAASDPDRRDSTTSWFHRNGRPANLLGVAATEVGLTKRDLSDLSEGVLTPLFSNHKAVTFAATIEVELAQGATWGEALAEAERVRKERLEREVVNA